jgi:hypothetical protein
VTAVNYKLDKLKALMTKPNTRRNFIKGSAALGAALIAPTFSKALSGETIRGA